MRKLMGITFLSFFVLVGFLGADPSPIGRMTVTPGVQHPPGKITVSFHLTPHKDNVQFCLGVVGVTDMSFRGSCQPLYGDRGPNDITLKYDRLGEGKYDVILELYRVPERLADSKKISIQVGDPDNF